MTLIFCYMLCGGELGFKANHSIKSWIPWQKSLWPQQLCCVLLYLVFSGVTEPGHALLTLPPRVSLGYSPPLSVPTLEMVALQWGHP